MSLIAFRMNLKPGHAAEYRRRHDAIWPELAELLEASGVSDYSIWLDEEAHHLFAIFKRSEDHRMDLLSAHPVMRRWWDYMADIMEVLPNNAPVQIPLRQMFHLE